MKTFTVACSAIALSLAAGQAMAQQISPADKTFATKAASGGQAEIALGKLASQNAADPQVRAFGERMVADHSQANDALMQIAKQQELAIPDKPDSADSATEQRLANLKGRSFDAAYMKDMVQDHQTDVADFRREAETGRDPQLKAFAQKYLPVLEQHLQMAETTNQRMEPHR